LIDREKQRKKSNAHNLTYRDNLYGKKMYGCVNKEDIYLMKCTLSIDPQSKARLVDEEKKRVRRESLERGSPLPL
jgi:hypothetical protein